MSENVTSFSAEAVAEIYSRHGYQVVRSESCWWFNEYRQKYVYFSSPLHWKVSPMEQEVREIFRQIPSAVALRFISPSSGQGKPSCIWNCRKPYSLVALEKKARNETRRGLEQCEVHPISFSKLIELGWNAHSDTFNRHGEQTKSLGFDVSLDSIPAYKAWGAFVGNELAAYLVVLLVDNFAHIIIERSVTSLLNHRPNNALVFRAVSELLSSGDIDVVSYGWDSLVYNSGLEQFKLGMGFIKEPVNQQIIVNPKFRLLFSKPLCKLVASIVPRKDLPHRFQQLLGLCEIVAAG